MGYHNREIQKGVFGEFSKIKEEFEELQDGIDQNNPVLVICELCDMLGAIESYASKWNLTMDDLMKMNRSTQSAFMDGSRRSNLNVYDDANLEEVVTETEIEDVNKSHLNELVVKTHIDEIIQDINEHAMYPQQKGTNESHLSEDNRIPFVDKSEIDIMNSLINPIEGEAFTVVESNTPLHIFGAPTTPVQRGLIRKLKEFTDLDTLFKWLDEQQIEVVPDKFQSEKSEIIKKSKYQNKKPLYIENLDHLYSSGVTSRSDEKL